MWIGGVVTALDLKGYLMFPMPLTTELKCQGALFVSVLLLSVAPTHSFDVTSTTDAQHKDTKYTRCIPFHKAFRVN